MLKTSSISTLFGQHVRADVAFSLSKLQLYAQFIYFNNYNPGLDFDFDLGGADLDLGTSDFDLIRIHINHYDMGPLGI